MLTLRKSDIKGQAKNLKLIDQALRDNFYTLIVGHTGTCKSSAIYAMANEHNKVITRINLTGQTGEDELAGKMGLIKGETVFVEGPLTRALREGHVVILDEINAANAEVLFLLHPLLDDGHFIRLMGKDGEIVPAHEDFRLFATMNPPEYVGTKELSPAFLSRFHMVLEFDFIQPIQEAKLLVERMNIREDDAATMADIAKRLRKKFEAGEMLTLISTRDLLSWARLHGSLKSMRQSFDATILNRAIQSRVDKEVLLSEIKTATSTGQPDPEAVEEPLTLIEQASALRNEFAAREVDIVSRLAECGKREKEIAEFTIERIRKLTSATGDGAETPKSGIGAQIKAARKQRGWTQKQLAIECSFPQPYVSEAESGVSKRPVVLDKISQVLGITFSSEEEPPVVVVGEPLTTDVVSNEDESENHVTATLSFEEILTELLA